jgi:hypothetical protein
MIFSVIIDGIISQVVKTTGLILNDDMDATALLRMSSLPSFHHFSKAGNNMAHQICRF